MSPTPQLSKGNHQTVCCEQTPQEFHLSEFIRAALISCDGFITLDLWLSRSIIIPAACYRRFGSSPNFIPIIYHSKSAELCKEYGVEEYASSVGDGENWEKSNINSEDIIKNIGKLEKDINFISHNNSILLAKKMNNKEKEIIKGL